MEELQAKISALEARIEELEETLKSFHVRFENLENLNNNSEATNNTVATITEMKEMVPAIKKAMMYISYTGNTGQEDINNYRSVVAGIENMNSGGGKNLLSLDSSSHSSHSPITSPRTGEEEKPKLVIGDNSSLMW